MLVQEFIAKPIDAIADSGRFTWTAPSNIALIKYWGKKPNQIPANPSISFTLDHCNTQTTLEFSKKADTDDFSFEVIFEGQPNEDFKPKIMTFLKRIHDYVPYLSQYHLRIDTFNTFPHSSGIASSASGMSALALCIMSIEKELNPEMDDHYFYRKASFLARLGSGSACRSIEGELIVWGTHQHIEGSSDLYGIRYPYDIHENFKNYQDTILLVDKGEKQVSSSVGHNLMHDHPFAEQRFKQAHEHMTAMIDILKSGDLNAFIKLVEREALTLHSMMMTSNPYYILMKPNTLKIIDSIWAFRKKTGMHLCFTLDAGANVHLLYPDRESKACLRFIEDELVQFCKNGEYIKDSLGQGAKEL